MKKMFTTVLFVGLCFIAYPQELTSLNAPSSPAASIIGLQPNAVLSPKTYKALEAALYSNFTHNNSLVIPNDFALEFTPYWTKNHGLSLRDYLFPKMISEQIKRTSSFSVASSNNFVLGDSSVTSVVGWGYRTTLHFPCKSDVQKVNSFSSKLYNVSIIIAGIGSRANAFATDKSIKNRIDYKEKIRPIVVDTILKYLGHKGFSKATEITNRIFKNYSSLPLYDPSNPYEFIDAFMELVEIELSQASPELDHAKIFNEFEDYIKKREGLLIDFAYAGYVNFPTNTFSISTLPQHSIWITPTYQFKDSASFLKVMGVFRYQFYDVDYYKRYFPASKVYQNNVDYGLAIALEYNKFSLQLEAVGRRSDTEIPSGIFINGKELYSKDKKSDFQCIGTFNYKLTDNFTLSYSLGDRFEPILNPGSTLVSLLSLNIGFTTKQEVK